MDDEQVNTPQPTSIPSTDAPRIPVDRIEKGENPVIIIK